MKSVMTVLLLSKMFRQLYAASAENFLLKFRLSKLKRTVLLLFSTLERETTEMKTTADKQAGFFDNRDRKDFYDFFLLDNDPFVKKEKMGNSVLYVFSKQALRIFAEGATFLSAGGGGPKQVAFNMLENSKIEEACGISIFPPDGGNCDNDFDTAMAGEVFAPSAIWNNQDYEACLQSFAALCPDYGVVYGIEIATINGLTAPICAGVLNHKDGKTCCFLLDYPSIRAIPKMNMDLYQSAVPIKKVIMRTKEGIGPAPLISLSCDALAAQDYIVDKMNHDQWGFSGVGGFAIYPYKLSELKNTYSAYLYPYAFNYAYSIGRAMSTPAFTENICQCSKIYTGYTPVTLFSGHFESMEKGAAANQDHMRITFKSCTDGVYEKLCLYTSNENLIAFLHVYEGTDYRKCLSVNPVAMGPDAITYLLMEDVPDYPIFRKGQSFTNEELNPAHYPADLFKNTKIAIMALPEQRMRNHDSLAEIFMDEIKLVMNDFEIHETIPSRFAPVENLMVYQPVISINMASSDTNAEQKNKKDCSEIPNYEVYISDETSVAKIYYTADGSVPDQSAALYTSPFLSYGGTLIRARAYKDSLTPSIIADRTVSVQ